MRPWLPLICVSLLLPGALAAAEEPAPPYVWSLGYEHGITLSRSLGPDWEVFLGGGYGQNGEDAPSTIQGSNLDAEQALTSWHFQDDGYDDYSSVSLCLGARRTVLRECRFRLSALLYLGYYGLGDHYRKIGQVGSGSYLEREVHRHHRRISCSVGLRPAIKLTKRITVATRFGFQYQLSDEIWDEDLNWLYDDDLDGFIDGARNTHRRSASRVTLLSTFGSLGFDYVYLTYRF